MKNTNISVLRSNGLSMAFGDFKVLKNIDLSIQQGEIVGVLGPNGAGKTTLMNATRHCRALSCRFGPHSSGATPIHWHDCI